MSSQTHDQNQEAFFKRLRDQQPTVTPSAVFKQSLDMQVRRAIAQQHRTNSTSAEHAPRSFSLSNLVFKYMFVPIGVVAALALVVQSGPLFGFPKFPDMRPPQSAKLGVVAPTVDEKALPTFASCSALQDKLASAAGAPGMAVDEAVRTLGMPAPMALKSESASADAAQANTGADFSQTNIQVQGVDEADIVKTDGTYIYAVSGSRVVITKAQPATDMELLGTIDLKDSYIRELYVQGNNLMVFGSRSIIIGDVPSGPVILEEESDPANKMRFAPEIYPYPGPIYRSVSFIELYNISDKQKPELKRKVEFEGDYRSSRKVGSWVYAVINSYPQYYPFWNAPRTNTGAAAAADQNLVPLFREQRGTTLQQDVAFEPVVGCNKVAYIDPIVSQNYITIVALPINSYTRAITREVILGAGENVYASPDSLYIAQTDYNAGSAEPTPLIRWVPPAQKTTVYKFNIKRNQVDYQGKNSVPGTILNQFSMDEHNDHFRIATTKGDVWNETEKSTSNVYVLDDQLKQVGAVEGIAPGERIYSTRFMGDRAYMVTFKKIDPFFVLDLSDPKKPTVLGKLKIPGYSDYLHPYDENHIIGIGKEAMEAENADFAWYQGMKMALFDVSDPENPKEISKVLIGDRGTDSPVLYDHKAFLFSKERNLLVLPVTLAELTQQQRDEVRQPGWAPPYGDFTFQGSYVYSIDPKNGFVLKGRVSHFDDDEAFKKSGYYFGDMNNTIKRNLYINDVLYSISDARIKANALSNLSLVDELDLQLPKVEYPTYYPMMPTIDIAPLPANMMIDVPAQTGSAGAVQ